MSTSFTRLNFETYNYSTKGDKSIYHHHTLKYIFSITLYHKQNITFWCKAVTMKDWRLREDVITIYVWSLLSFATISMSFCLWSLCIKIVLLLRKCVQDFSQSLPLLCNSANDTWFPASCLYHSKSLIWLHLGWSISFNPCISIHTIFSCNTLSLYIIISLNTGYNYIIENVDIFPCIYHVLILLYCTPMTIQLRTHYNTLQKNC